MSLEMETSDIRNYLTPISLGTNAHPYPSRILRMSSDSDSGLGRCSLAVSGRSTSTPIIDDDSSASTGAGLSRNSRREFVDLECSYLDMNESPIIVQHPRINLASVPIFGRKQSLDSDRLSTTSVAATLGKMELCDNNNDDNNNDKPQNLNKDNILEDVPKEVPEEGTSSFHVHEQFKKHVNKNKKRKSISTKHKSPKVYKIGTSKKMVNSEGTSKRALISNKLKTSNETTKKRVKSLKSNSPKLQKVSSKKGTSLTVPSKKGMSTNKQKKLPDTSEKPTINKKSSTSGSQCSALKVSKCAKSPKLRTAERAMIKQYREEVRKEKEKEVEAYKNKLLEEQKRQEEKENQKMRQQTIFKAKPIRKYAPLPVVEKRLLTDPISPKFIKRRRIEQSTQSSNTN